MISLQSYEPGALRVPLKSPVRENRTPGSVRGRPGNRAFLPRYHPQLGRWLSRDPIEEQDGENLFLYIFNHPESRNDFLGLISNAECQEKMNKAKTTGLTNRISQEISNKKCYIEIKCICCEGETAKFGGYTEFKGTITVTLCSNNLKNDSEVSTLLTHEMTHALQYCRNKDRSSSCEQRVCDELQAYTTDGSASSLPPDKKKNDIINRAAQSAQRDCGNDFERAHREAAKKYEQCAVAIQPKVSI